MFLYAISAFDPSREMQACNVVTAVPAGFEYAIVGFCSSVKFGADVMVACLGILSKVADPEQVVLESEDGGKPPEAEMVMVFLPSALCATVFVTVNA